MTLSQSVCVFVCFSVPFFLLVSLKFLLVLKSFNGVSRLFKGCLMFQGSFKQVLQSGFKGLSRKLKGCFKEVLRVFQGSFKTDSKKFQDCFKEV